MKNWMLISCFERDIDRPLFFNTKDEAFKAMVEDFANTTCMTVEEAMEVYNSGEHVYCEVTDNEAWCNEAWCNNRGNYDWKIFNIGGDI